MCRKVNTRASNKSVEDAIDVIFTVALNSSHLVPTVCETVWKYDKAKANRRLSMPVSDMPWLKSHLGTLENAVAIINRYNWNLEVVQQDERWYVLAGTTEKRIVFESASRDSLDSFLYGMGLAAATIPAHAIDKK